MIANLRKFSANSKQKAKKTKIASKNLSIEPKISGDDVIKIAIKELFSWIFGNYFHDPLVQLGSSWHGISYII